MIIRIVAALACLAIAACVVQPPPDTAALPFAAFGTLDNDVAAANQAAWAFAAPARTANNPVDAARAAAGIDYLAGELSSNPRWVMVSPLTKQEMLQARVDVRQVLGIAPDAVAGDGRTRCCSSPGCGRPAIGAQRCRRWPRRASPCRRRRRPVLEPTCHIIRSANIASSDAANQMLPSGDGIRRS